MCSLKYMYVKKKISFGSKVIAFFVKKLPKLNIQSVIAID